jgi:predicted nucleic acid-binding protein
VKVLVDTSVWVAHFKQRNAALVDLLVQGRVVCHPYVVMEVACGTPPDRSFVIDLLTELDQAPTANTQEMLHLLNTHALYGRGCGLVDLGLLASTLMRPATQLWTLDKRLHALATEFNLAYAPNTPPTNPRGH